MTDHRFIPEQARDVWRIRDTSVPEDAPEADRYLKFGGGGDIPLEVLSRDSADDYAAEAEDQVDSERATYQRERMCSTYKGAIAAARDLIDDAANYEYARGIAEMIAEAFGYMEGEDEMYTVRKRIAVDLGLPSIYFD